jgi:hypothetical protein
VKKASRFVELSSQLTALLDSDPVEAVRMARKIDLDNPDRFNLMALQAAALVDGGAATHQLDAVEEGLALFRLLQSHFPSVNITYNLANGLVAAVGHPPRGSDWLEHQERTRDQRSEARRCYWDVAQHSSADLELRTQAWTNIANQFSGSFRLGEAHDARLAALKLDPANGVAAGSAAMELLWLFEQGGCSDLTRVEAIMLAKIASRNPDRVKQYAGAQAAHKIAVFSNELGDPPPRSPSTDPFISWVERERLTLAPVVEMVDPDLGKLDWLMLPGILEREADAKALPPPVFAMFNILKSDFILARDLAWRATQESAWSSTGRFSDTLDYAAYGPEVSAFCLSHRTALDLLDKVAVTANHYFKLGQQPDKIYFGKLWRRGPTKTTEPRLLTEAVERAIQAGAKALYGLVELADDYDNKKGILRSQKDLRNASTHRFVVLHDIWNAAHSRAVPEVERHSREQFKREVMRALRVARSAIQMLALAISQYERGLSQRANGRVGELFVPDHDWVRGRK